MNIEELTDAYLETLLWSSPVGELGDKYADDYEHAPGLRDECREAVEDFLTVAGGLLAKAAEVNEGYDAEAAMHDFALSRNGHGAGFWDRGLGGVGEALHSLAKSFGPHEVYLGDDNLIHGL